MSKWLIETEALAALLAAGPDADRVVLDCSWYVPDAGRNGHEDFRAGHIPGALFVDLNAISDPQSPYVNMLPEAPVFAREMGALGIGAETEVILYDAGYVSARLWWMLRSFGHDRVKILNGGWRRWLAEQRPVATGDFIPPAAQDFPARLAPNQAVSLAEMRQLVDQGASIIDARTAARFDGHEGSGYPGVASGYMPGAINTPWALFYEPAPSHRFVSAERAAAIFAEKGVDLSGEVITTCGSGVTASILGFMLEAIGHPQWRLYDGSWHEWGQQDDTPKLVKPQ